MIAQTVTNIIKGRKPFRHGKAPFNFFTQLYANENGLQIPLVKNLPRYVAVIVT
ncbi:hypothetical protein JCM15765_42880 [Paradesulfitobacterium aromaticivorans]